MNQVTTRPHWPTNALDLGRRGHAHQPAPQRRPHGREAPHSSSRSTTTGRRRHAHCCRRRLRHGCGGSASAAGAALVDGAERRLELLPAGGRHLEGAQIPVAGAAGPRRGGAAVLCWVGGCWPVGRLVVCMHVDRSPARSPCGGVRGRRRRGGQALQEERRALLRVGQKAPGAEPDPCQVEGVQEGGHRVEHVLPQRPEAGRAPTPRGS